MHTDWEIASEISPFPRVILWPQSTESRWHWCLLPLLYCERKGTQAINTKLIHTCVLVCMFECEYKYVRERAWLTMCMRKPSHNYRKWQTSRSPLTWQVEVVLAPADAIVRVAPVVDAELIAIEGAGGDPVQLGRKIALWHFCFFTIWNRSLQTVSYYKYNYHLSHVF